jgi:adenylate cyclase
MSNVRSIVDWLEDGARSAVRSEDVLAELCARLVECGIPLGRAAVFVTTPHPDIMGRSFRWEPGAEVKVSAAPWELMQTAEFRDSPVAAVYRTGELLRRHLDDPNCPDDFAMLRNLRAEGTTDYVAFPLVFTNGHIHVATWTTKRKGGFTPQEFSALESITAPLARVAEVRALQRTAQNLLDTYIGHQAGERIMAGKIRRGYIEAIRAAIWLSDMRGFTTLSERLPPQELIDLLNRYFDAQVPAILESGGEVLKFMGDGLLAIFPIANDDDAAAVCRRALACALAVRDRVAELPRKAEDAEGTRFGLALHAGEVMYGNIGGGNRLDFTCIGPAVNLAARLEKVAAKLGETIVASAAFARHFPGELVSRGEFPVAGFAAPQTVYGFPQ